MKRLKISILLIVYLYFSMMAVHSFSENICCAESDTESDLSGIAYVLMEGSTGTVLEKNRESDVMPSGTLNKLMTALLVMEKIDEGKLSMETVVTASADACDVKGAVIWLERGHRITVYELMKGMLAGNANDAANVLAETVSDTREEFVSLMNRRAAELGMENTVFTKPGETDDENQVTTALDMAVLSRMVSSYTVLHEIMTTGYELIREDRAEVVNENRLVRSYSGITGLKAGHTEASGYSVAASAKRQSGNYIAVVLGCEDEYRRFSVAEQLLNNGFTKYKSVTPGFSTEYMKPLEVRHGIDSAVQLKAYRISELIVRRGTEGKIKNVIVLPKYIEAPVRRNQCVGVLAFYSGDTLLYETPLVAGNSVQKNTFLKSLKKIVSKMFK